MTGPTDGRRRLIARRRAGIVALLGAALLAPTGAASAAEREPYPPARLWYRVSVEFKGRQVITVAPSGLPTDFDASWKLESRHAVRLTLLCQNVKPEFPQPFEWEERIGGRKRRVGGCPRPTKEVPRKNLRETVRFAATATGAVTRWKHDSPIDFGHGCPGRIEHYELVQHHALTGQISSPSSATAGLFISAEAVQPSTVSVTAPAIDCLLTPQGPVYNKPAIASSYPSTSLLFGEDRDRLNDQPIGSQLAVRFPPERFGRDYIYTRELVQPEGVGRYGKNYTYTVRFTACPRRGRDVEGCAAGDASAASRDARPPVRHPSGAGTGTAGGA